jgi:hypothetical protein
MITFELCVKAVFTAVSRPSGDLTRLIPTERKRTFLNPELMVFLKFKTHFKSCHRQQNSLKIQIEKVGSLAR